MKKHLSLFQYPLEITTWTLDEEVSADISFVCLLLKNILREIRLKQEEDEVWQQVEGYCDTVTGWPERKFIRGPVKSYLSNASQLSAVDESLIRGGLIIVIPTSTCLNILDRLHFGYQGIS